MIRRKVIVILREMLLFLVVGIAYIFVGEYTSKFRLKETQFFSNSFVKVIMYLIVFALTLYFKGKMDRSVEGTIDFYLFGGSYFLVFVIIIGWSNKFIKHGFGKNKAKSS